MVLCMSKLATLEIKRNWQMDHMQTEVSREAMPMMGIFPRSCCVHVLEFRVA